MEKNALRVQLCKLTYDVFPKVTFSHLLVIMQIINDGFLPKVD
jgi:hypothetical protein